MWDQAAVIVVGFKEETDENEQRGRAEGEQYMIAGVYKNNLDIHEYYQTLVYGL